MSKSDQEISQANKWRLPEWYPELGDTLLQDLRKYHLELIRFNGTINLISPRTEVNADLVHFADSVAGGRLILEKTDSERIFDIGSGNGFPGLIMACLARDREFVLLDKDARKLEFCKHVAGILKLENVRTLHNQVEALPADLIQCAVSRGFAPLSNALVATRKVFAKGAHYYHFKGDSWVREVADIPTQVCSVWSPKLSGEYSLPKDVAKLVVVETKKIG